MSCERSSISTHRTQKEELLERERLQNYVSNGTKAQPTFSDAEMQHRLDSIRDHMAKESIDAALFNSYR